MMAERELLVDLRESREIDHVQFLAGCMWQNDWRKAQIQPPRGLDWSVSLYSQKLYQQRGNPNDIQSHAMTIRNAVTRSLGKRRSGLLDYLIRPETTRSVLRERHGTSYAKLLVDSVIEALTSLAVCLGLRTAGKATAKLASFVKPEQIRSLRQMQPDLFVPIKKRGKDFKPWSWEFRRASMGTYVGTRP